MYDAVSTVCSGTFEFHVVWYKKYRLRIEHLYRYYHILGIYSIRNLHVPWYVLSICVAICNLLTVFVGNLFQIESLIWFKLNAILCWCWWVQWLHKHTSTQTHSKTMFENEKLNENEVNVNKYVKTILIL